MTITYQTSLSPAFAHPQINELPLREQPTTRIREHGSGALSTAELLTIICGMDFDPAHELLRRFQDLRRLRTASIPELTQIPGIGPHRAKRLLAALELAQRVLETTAERPQMGNPSDIGLWLIPKLGHLNQEQFHVLPLNTKNRLIRDHLLYQGSLNASIIRVAEIFNIAITEHAAGIIIAHNHPSGSPEPSAEDIKVTHQIINAGKLLDIEVVDHIIVGHNRYVSLRQRGLAFDPPQAQATQVAIQTAM